MKKIKYILFAAFIASSLPACKKDFLEGKPYSFTTTENFYKTALDAEIALSGCYNTLNANNSQGENSGIFVRELPYMVTGSTDENINRDGFSSPDYTPWGLASWTSQTEFNRRTWFGLFVGVNRCNTLLEKLDGIDMNVARKKEIAGEAHFLRGLYYMYLGMMYGGVPVYISSPQDASAPRQSLKDVFELVISDFQFAYQNLPPRASIGARANKWSAAGFLAKSYAYLGSSKLNGNGADLNFNLNSFNWVDAADVYAKTQLLTQDIIDNSGYKLTPVYGNLFRETTKAYQKEECLFIIESSSDPANGNQLIWIDAFIPFGNRDRFGGGTARLVPLGELYKSYNAADNRRSWNITGALGSAPATEQVDGITYYVPPVANLTKAIYNSKFRYRDPKLKTFTNSNSDGDYPILRFADILLIHAEAIYYTSGDVNLARTFLSRVRKRATTATTTTILDAAYLNTNFVDELLDERSRELCMETQRHFDLARFGRYTSRIKNLSSDKALGLFNVAVPILQANWAPHRIWFPIPLTELTLNKNMVQNPGY